MSNIYIQSELKELRDKMQFLKENNKFISESSKNAQNLFNWKSDFVDETFCLDNEIIRTKDTCQTKQLMDTEEAFIVANCYRKTLKLLKERSIEKKKKQMDKILKFGNRENISRNYVVAPLNSCPSSFGEHYQNISDTSKRWFANQTTNECDITSCNQYNPYIIDKKKRRKTLEDEQGKHSSVILKHYVDKYLQNDSNTRLKETNINIRNSWTNDVSPRSVPQLNGKNEINKHESFSSIKTEARKVYADKKKQCRTNTKQEITKCKQSVPKIHQQIAEDLDIVYVKNVNVSQERVILKDRNFTKEVSENSYHNKDWISPEALGIKSGLSDMSVEEDESEIITPVWDFTEEPVDFVIPDLHLSEKILYFSKQKIQYYKSMGIPIKEGKWTEEEKALLIRNYNNFASRFGINDARLLLGIGRYISNNKHENRNIQKFLKVKHFILRLGKDLNDRTLFHIYYKARHLLDPLYKNKSGHKNISLLVQLQKKYGNKWQLIAKKFGRSPSYCQMFYYYYRNIFVT